MKKGNEDNLGVVVAGTIIVIIAICWAFWKVLIGG